MSVERFAALGVSTVYEASGRAGLIASEYVRVVPGSRTAGYARTVRCGQDDNLGVHEALDALQPGEVLVATMPVAGPIALVGELLAVQARARGARALLIDAAVRDIDELQALGLPVWARWVSSRGALKATPGEHQAVVDLGGTKITPGDLLVLDGDGVVVVTPDRMADVLAASEGRAAAEQTHLQRLAAGEATLDVLQLRNTTRSA